MLLGVIGCAYTERVAAAMIFDFLRLSVAFAYCALVRRRTKLEVFVGRDRHWTGSMRF